MTLESRIANLFQMDDQTWKHHANPWSFWTRLTVLPLLILAFWSRIWLGWWSIALVILSLIWNWINPRIFAIPKSTNNWVSKAVLGERVWLNRDVIEVPQHHQLMPNILTSIGTIGIILVIVGLINLEIDLTLIGTILVYTGKLWFLDRMVWLYEDMKDHNEVYQSWLY